jgi:hypothetical protein
MLSASCDFLGVRRGAKPLAGRSPKYIDENAFLTSYSPIEFFKEIAMRRQVR